MSESIANRVQSTFTRCALYLELFAHEARLSSATGFVIRPGGVGGDPLYLVTNWHVVSGRNADTNSCLSDKAALPTSVHIHHHSRSDMQERVRREEPLYFDEDFQRPRWLEHPRGREVDVVLLPIERVEHPVAIQAVQLGWFGKELLELPGLAVSVIGFPHDLHVESRWPIWKTGHLASDPGFDYDHRPSFLIDITTRNGMSGAPIVFQSAGPFLRSDGEQTVNSMMRRQFLGVYSGRLPYDTELGKGWRPEVILEILDAHDIPYYL